MADGTVMRGASDNKMNTRTRLMRSNGVPRYVTAHGAGDSRPILVKKCRLQTSCGAETNMTSYRRRSVIYNGANRKCVLQKVREWCKRRKTQCTHGDDRDSNHRKWYP